MTNREIESALEWRYATKKFDATKKISSADWDTLAQSLLLSPSSYGLQPWKFLVVQNEALRNRLKPLTWNQSQVTDCSHYVVFLHLDKVSESYVEHFIDRNTEVRNVSKEALKGYQNVMLEDLVKGPRSHVIQTWASRQAYIAMGFLMETAALLSIDACPIEGLDTNAYDEALQLKGTGYQTVATVALGYRHADDKYQLAKKVRFPLSEMIEFRN